MRICVLIDAWEPVWGGGQTNAWEISTQLVRTYGFRIDLFVRALVDEKGKVYARSESHEGGKIRIIRVGPPSTFFALKGRVGWLFHVILAVVKEHKQAPYDLIHAHAYLPALPARVLAWILRIPVVFTVHGSLNLDQGFSLAALLEKVLLSWIPFDAEISVSRSFLKYPNINKSVQVIPNGVKEINLLQHRKKRQSTKLTLLAVGRLEKQKGFDLLLQAYFQLRFNYPRTKLRLVGEGSQKKDLLKLTQELQIEQNVVLVGRLTGKQLFREYRQADIFVLPSRAEGHAVAILEALAAGLPVIATDVGDNRQLVKDGLNGFLVRSENIASLVAALQKMCASPKRFLMGKEGQRMVATHFTWKKVAEKTAMVYQQTLLKYRAI